MNNPVLTSGLLAWLVAQLIKTVLHAFKSDKIVYTRLVGAGGMPSSHTALVIAALIKTGRIEGTSSSVFGIAFIFAAIVIYDAMNVRHAAGLHARELNIINRIFTQKNIESENENSTRKELNEFLGHTPLEVIGGAVVGIAVALLF